MIHTCIRTGSAPRLDMLVSMTPVDYVSRAMVYLALHGSAGPDSTWHLVNPQPISWMGLVRWMAGAGFPLREVAYPQWQDELRALARSARPGTLHPLAPLLADEQLTEAALCGQMRALRADCGQTLSRLSEALISCPPVDAGLLRTYFAAFVHSRFLSLTPERQ